MPIRPIAAENKPRSPRLSQGLTIEAVDLECSDFSSTDTHNRLIVLMELPLQKKEVDIAALRIGG